MSRATVCTIGTMESHLAVGLGLDLCVLAELGVRAVAVCTAVSAQDSAGIHALAAIAPDVVAAQLASLRGVEIDAFRIGALPDAATAGVIARALASRRVPVVYDPVLASSAGGAFTDAQTLGRIAQALFPYTSVVTPNLAEAQLLTGLTVDGLESMVRAAKAIVERGAQAVLVKGGHLAGVPQDVLFVDGDDGEDVRVFAQERLAGEMRGTGCVLAASLAAALAQGAALPDAVERARAFVRRKIVNAREFGGMRTAY